MDDLILKNKLKNEKGFLLLESLVGLSILSILMLVLYPIVVDWLLLVEIEKKQVEISRALYETSIEWPNASKDKHYIIQQTKESLVILDKNNKVDVHIYDTHFER